MSIKAIIKTFSGIQSQSLLGFLLFVSTFAFAQTLPVTPAPGATCVVSALNRNATMDGDYYVIPSVPAQRGNYRVRAICSDGMEGQTGLVTPVQITGAAITAGLIKWGYVTPVPQSLTMDAPANMNYGQSVQLTTKAVALDTSVSDVTSAAQGTNYVVSAPWLASVSANGLLTVLPNPYANYASQVVVSATNQGTPMARLINIGPRAPINGKVTLADGVTPAAGVQVSLQLNAPLTRLPAITTNASGSFTLANAAAGDYTVAVTDPVTGNRGNRTSTLAANGSGTFDVRLVGQGNINITVLGSGDQPVTGAQVVLSNAQFAGAVKATQTNVSGVAAVSGFLAGNFNLTVSDTVTGGIATASGSLAANGVVNLTVKLQPVGIISGAVLAADAVTPQPGLQVRLLSASKGIVSSAIAGVDGKFRFDSLPLADSPYTLLAVAAGSVQGSVANLVLTYANQELLQNIQLGTFASGGIVSGKVTNENNAPQANFAVILTNSTGQQQLTNTDAQGNYQIFGVPLGAFTVTSGVTGYQGSASGTVNTNGEQVNASMTVQAYGQVAGTVLLSTGQPAANINIVYHSGMNSVRQLTTDGSGYFVVDHALVGIYSVEANDPVTGERGFVNGILSSPNEAQLHQLSLTAVSKLHVQVTYGGVPVANAKVNLALQGLITYGAELTTDANGIVEFAAVPKSKYSLAVISTANGIKSGRATGVLKQATETISVAINTDYFAPYTVYGQVLDTKAMPVANQWVRLSSRIGLALNPPAYNWDEYLVKTDESGNFIFQNVLVHDGGRGTLLLDALVYNQLAGRVNMTTPTSGQMVNQDIALFTAGKVLGQVKNVNSTPVVSVPIVLTHQSTALYATDDFITQTDAQGLYVMQFVPMGGFTVSVRDGGGGSSASATASLQQEGQIVTLNFNNVETGAITGSVQFEAGATIPYQLVQIIDINGAIYKQVYTDQNGIYWVSQVAAGKYTIKLQNGNFTFAESLPELTGQTVVKNIVVTSPLLIKVKRNNGTPLAGATVYGNYSNGYSLMLGLTNAEGEIGVNASNCSVFTKYSASYPGNVNVIVTTTVSTPPCNQAQVLEMQFIPIADIKILATQNGIAPMAGAEVFNVVGQNQIYWGSTDNNGVFSKAGVIEGSYNLLVKSSQGLSQQVSLVVDAASDGSIISRVVDFVTQFDKYGTLSFGAEKHLYSIAVKQGDSLAIAVHGAAVDGTYAAYMVNATVYSQDKTFLASGYGFGSAFNYNQYNSSGDLKNIPVDADGNYVVAIQPYYPNYLGGYFLSASVNGLPVEIKPYQGGGSVQGTIHRFDGVLPMPNETVEISTQDVLGMHLRTTTDASGHYQFDNVPLADLTVAAIETEQVMVSATDKLVAQGQVIIKDMTLPQKTTLQVTITVADYMTIPNYMYFNVMDNNGVHSAGPVYFGGNRTSTSLTTVALGDSITVTAIDPSNANNATTKVVSGANEQTLAVNLLLESATAGGTVFHADGSVAPYSLVSAYRAGDHAYISSTYSDNFGVYVLSALPVGQELVIAAQSSMNHVDSTITVTLSGGQQLAGQDIKLIATGVIEGYVKRTNGTPLVGANIVVSGTANGAGFVMQSVSTDSNGYFNVTSVPVGVNVEVAATASDLLGAKSQFTIVNLPDAVVTLPDFMFASGATLQVKVFDGNHQFDPLIFDGVGSECGPNVIAITTSDGNQIYRNAINTYGNAIDYGYDPITDLPEGLIKVSYYSTCDNPQWSSAAPLATASTVVSGTQTFQLDILVPIVKVKVRSADGIPMGADVSLTYIAPDGSTITRTPFYRTGGLSIWQYLMGVPPGDFVIDGNASFNGQYYRFSQSGTMLGVANMNVDVVVPFTYTGPSIVVGTVSFIDGRSVQDANLSLYQNGHTQFAYTYNSGSYLFYPLDIGPFELTAQDPYTGLTVTAKGVVVDGQATVLDLVMPPTGSVTGTLYDANGDPLSNAFVVVSSTVVPIFDKVTWTDGQGVYLIDHIPVGRVKVTSYDSQTGTVLVNAGTLIAQSETITVDLHETAAGPGQISGVVKHSDGTPVESAEITINQLGVLDTFLTYGLGNFLFDSPLPGAFQITAKETSSGLTASANDSVIAGMTTTIDLVIPLTGSVSGVLLDINGAAIPNAAIDITSSGVVGWTLHTISDATGAYRFNYVPIGNVTLVAINPATKRSISGTGSLSVQNELITVLLQEIPFVPGQVTGTVRMADGTPVISADVWLNLAGNAYHTLTDQAGSYLFVNLPPGTFQISALDGNNTGETGSASGVLLEGTLSTVDVRLVESGSVAGTLYDLSGLPVANASVELTTTGDVNLVMHAVTDAAGAYRIDQVPLGLISTVAVNPMSQKKVYGIGNLVALGQLIYVDMWERVSSTGQISGTVNYSDGQVVQRPSVSLFQNGITTYASTDISGNYLFGPIAPGSVEITAQDGNSGLTTIINANVLENVNATFDFSLPASGSVMGIFTDSNGAPIPNAEIDIYSSGTPGFSLYANTDTQGNYRIDHIALGDITVIGWTNTTQNVVMKTGKLSTDQEIVTVNLQEIAGGIVNGNVFADAAGTSLPAVNVTLVTKSNLGPVNSIWQNVSADNAGVFSFTSVPPGAFRLFVTDPANSANVGIADGVSVMNATVNLDVTLGNGVGMPFMLNGTNGNQYQVQCDGSLYISTPSYSAGMYGLRVNNVDFPCWPGSAASADMRELTFGPTKIDALQVSRRVFSPLTGDFVRFIDTYANPGNVDANVVVQVSPYNLPYLPLYVDPVSNGQTYAVLSESATSQGLAAIFGGSGNVNSANTFQYKRYQGVSNSGVPNYWGMQASYNWNLTVPAGKSISLMHYATQAAAASDAQALGLSLSTYAAPFMLDGVIRADIPSIYNFPNANY